MGTETTTSSHSTLQLLTLNGPEYRRVSTAPPRVPSVDEIPVINLSQLEGDLGARKELAQKVKLAAENTGFFYICNHGIPDELIQGALHQAKAFFNQSDDMKEKVDRRHYKEFQGYHGVSTTQINDSETKGKQVRSFIDPDD